MPGLRFAIGAGLAIALLIVAVLGLAATVQVAHHRSATADDPWRTLAYPDPTDWGLLADRSRPATVAKSEIPEVPAVPQAAVMAPAPETTADNARASNERVVSQEAEAAAAAEQPTLDPPPATVPAAPLTASTEATEPAVVPTEHEPVDVVAAIPETTAAPVQPAEPAPATEQSAKDDEPLEPSERVGALPAFPTAGHGFVPPEHPIALPIPLPPSKPAVKNPQKKRVARSRPRTPALLPSPPLANTGYPTFGYGPNGKTAKTTGYDKIWTAE